MPFAFPAYHEEYWAPDVLPDRELVLAVAQALNWRLVIEPTGPIGWRWRFEASLNFWSWGEIVILEPQLDNSLYVRSSCVLFTQCFDWGRNKQNVQQLRTMLQYLSTPASVANAPS